MPKNKPIKVLFGGYYGMKNYGDDLFGLIASKGTDLYWPDVTPTLACPPITGVNSSYLVPKRFSNEIYSSSGYIGKMSRYRYLTKGASSSDKFIFFGGSLFSSNKSAVFDLLIKRNLKRDKFFSAMGVSLGPFDSIASENTAIEQIKAFEYLAFRDRNSYELALSYNIDCPCVLSADPAGLMPNLGYVNIDRNVSIKVNNKTKRVGFSPCFLKDNMDSSNNFCNIFVDSITSLVSEIDIEVAIINLNNHKQIGDYKLCKNVFNQLKNANIKCKLINYYDIGVVSTWKEISSLDAYIGMRLHGALTAYVGSVPFLLYEYHEKCKNFLDDIEQRDNLGINDKSLSFEYLKSAIYQLLMGQIKINPTKYQKRSESLFLSHPSTKG